MADTDLDELVETCCAFVEQQRRLIERATAYRTVSPAVVTAMDAALDQLETAVLHVCQPDRLHPWWDPGE